MSIRFSVPEEHEKLVNKVAKVRKCTPEDAAAFIFRSGISRVRALMNYAAKDDGAAPKAPKAKASPKAKKTTAKTKPVAAPVKGKPVLAARAKVVTRGPIRFPAPVAIPPDMVAAAPEEAEEQFDSTGSDDE